MDFEEIKKIRVCILKVTTRAQARAQVQEVKTQHTDQETGHLSVYECLNTSEISKLARVQSYLTNDQIVIEVKKGNTIKYKKDCAPNNERDALELTFKEMLHRCKYKKVALSLEDMLLTTLGKEKIKEIIRAQKSPKTIILFKPRILIKDPKDIQEILRQNHDLPTANHPGQRRMYKRIIREYTWRNMKNTIREFIKKCENCKLNKINNHTREPMLKTSTPNQPMQVVAIDTVGPLSLTENGNKYALTVQCELTKYVIAIPIPNKEAKTIARALVDHIILTYGPMAALKGDQGTEYINEVLTEVLSTLGIDKQNSTAYRPQTIGGLERNHRVLNEFFRSTLSNSLYGWDHWLPYYCFSYNTTPNSVHDYTPFELMFGRAATFRNSKVFSEMTPLYNLDNYAQEMKFRLQMAYERTRGLIEKDKQRRVDKDLTTNFNSIRLRIGDKVKLKVESRSKLEPFYDGPYIIESINENNNITINKNDKKQIVHKNRLILWD